MRFFRFAPLIPLAVLMSCASGRTVRVAEGDEADKPVALAPVPETDPDAAAGAPSQPVPVADTTTTPVTTAQGYAPYGSNPSLEVRRIGQWAHTGVGEARRMVIRDANAWEQLWAQVGSGDRPDVDFTQNVVIAAASGARPTGGHEIAVASASATDGQLTIEVVETSPGPNCVTTGGATQPVDVVVIPTVPRSWNFVERKEMRACR